jgi:hypothetical protein
MAVRADDALIRAHRTNAVKPFGKKDELDKLCLTGSSKPENACQVDSRAAVRSASLG